MDEPKSLLYSLLKRRLEFIRFESYRGNEYYGYCFKNHPSHLILFAKDKCWPRIVLIHF